MDVFETIKNRRSIRKYKQQRIPEKHLKKILEAARLAPSARNRQPWRFVLVRGIELKKSIAKAAKNQMFIADAGAIVVALGDPEASYNWYEKDTMTAIEHIVLASTGLGYGTCWIGDFIEEEVKRIIEIPSELKVVALLPIGVPDENPRAKLRRNFNEIFFGEKYGISLEI